MDNESKLKVSLEERIKAAMDRYYKANNKRPLLRRKNNFVRTRRKRPEVEQEKMVEIGPLMPLVSFAHNRNAKGFPCDRKKKECKKWET